MVFLLLDRLEPIVIGMGILAADYVRIIMCLVLQIAAIVLQGLIAAQIKQFRIHQLLKHELMFIQLGLLPV